MEMINDLVSRGLILPHVSHSFPLAEVRVRTPSQLSVYTRDLCPGEGGAARQVGQEDRGRRRGGLQLARRQLSILVTLIRALNEGCFIHCYVCRARDAA